jgi:hypothetical protein
MLFVAYEKVSKIEMVALRRHHRLRLLAALDKYLGVVVVVGWYRSGPSRRSERGGVRSDCQVPRP